MKDVKIQGSTYQMVKNFRDDDALRKSFNQLTEQTFGFSFEDWYKDGWWSDGYIPYSLKHEGEIVANVSISRMTFDIENQRKSGIQIGTVMTDEKYRNKGLSRLLMELVMKDWQDQADFIYLFANDSVLDFYPKFNFHATKQCQHRRQIKTQGSQSDMRKLNVDESADVKLLLDTIAQNQTMSKITMRDNAALIMFYLTSFKRDCIHYFEKSNAIAIAATEENTLYLDEVFCQDTVVLNEIIDALCDENVRQVVLGFTPKDDAGFSKQLVSGADTLFFFNGKPDFFDDQQHMFPVLSHG